MSETANDAPVNLRLDLYRLLEIAGQKKIKLVFSAAFSILGSVSSLVPFVVIYYMSFELLQPAVNQELVWTLAFCALAGVICRFIFQYLSVVLSHIAAYDILYGLRRELADHMGSLPMGYFSRQSGGGIKKIINDDIEEIELFIAHHIPDIITAAALPAITLAFLFFKDWRMTLAALIPLPLAYLAQRMAYMGSPELSIKYHHAMERMNATIIEYVRGMPVIKVFNQTVRSFTGFRDSVTDFQQLCIQWSRKAAPPFAMFTVLVNATLFFLLPVGVWLFLGGTLSIPVFLLFLLLGIGYSGPLIRLAGYGELMQQINQGVRRMDSILRQDGVAEPEHPLLPNTHDIEFRRVGFAYDEKQVLDDISFTADARSVTALVGPSGAGKTTIAQLIPRFWDVGAGDIRIGGVDIRRIPYQDLMQMISFVFQDVFLFNDTIHQNISIGNPAADDRAVIEAAKVAQAHDFVSQLPDGYRTVFGSAACHLSGGEKQRISVARAILKDAPIVVLDEATAFADPENEAKIQAGFNRLMRDKTVIVIAHRLSTIRHADRIIVIDEGRIAESGTHAALIEKKGTYETMWNAHMDAQKWKFEL